MVLRFSRLLLAAMLLGACSTTTPSKDPGADASAAGTVHDIDSNLLPEGTPVTLVGLVITGVALPAGVESTGSQRCKYRAFAQDPQGAAPAGIMLYTFGIVCPGGNCTCPDIPKSGTPLDGVLGLSDIYNVAGSTSIVVARDDAGAPLLTEHAVIVKGLTKTGINGVVKPEVFQDPFEFAKLSPSYQGYESMVVTIQPPSPFGVGSPNLNGAFSGAGAFYSGIYGDNFEMGGKFPASNQKFISITGIAIPIANGAIAPRQATDFIAQ